MRLGVENPRRQLQDCIIRFLSFAVLTFGLQASANADFVNGGFEAGNFSGWQAVGSNSIESGGFGIMPPEGDNQALLSSHPPGGYGIPADQVEAFLGLRPGILSAQSTSMVTQGSAIKQTIFANSGDLIVFDWSFLTNEDTASAETNDFAFMSVAVESSSTLSDTFSSLQESPAAVFRYDTGYQTWAVAVPVSGIYTIGFGVVDVGDTNVASGLLIDDVKLVAAVPEPSSLLLSVIGGVPLITWGFTRACCCRDKVRTFICRSQCMDP